MSLLFCSSSPTDDRDVNEIVPVDDDMKVRLPLGRDDVEVLLVFFQTWQEK